MKAIFHRQDTHGMNSFVVRAPNGKVQIQRVLGVDKVAVLSEAIVANFNYFEGDDVVESMEAVRSKTKFFGFCLGKHFLFLRSDFEFTAGFYDYLVSTGYLVELLDDLPERTMLLVYAEPGLHDDVNATGPSKLSIPFIYDGVRFVPSPQISEMGYLIKY